MVLGEFLKDGNSHKYLLTIIYRVEPNLLPIAQRVLNCVASRTWGVGQGGGAR